MHGIRGHRGASALGCLHLQVLARFCDANYEVLAFAGRCDRFHGGLMMSAEMLGRVGLVLAGIAVACATAGGTSLTGAHAPSAGSLGAQMLVAHTAQAPAAGGLGAAHDTGTATVRATAAAAALRPAWIDHGSDCRICGQAVMWIDHGSVTCDGHASSSTVAA